MGQNHVQVSVQRPERRTVQLPAKLRNSLPRGSKVEMEIPIEGMKVSGRTYVASSARRTLIVSIFVALYAIVLPYCYQTAGEPRAAAAISAQKIADDKWEQYSNGNFTADAELDIDFIALAKGERRGKDEKKMSTNVGNLEDLEASEAAMHIGDFGGEEDKVTSFGEKSSNSTSGGWLSVSSWFGPSKEQKRAEAEQERLIKEFNKGREQ